MNIFEKASRDQLRFSVAKGQISHEDLWGYSIQSLADLGKTLKAKLKPLKEEDDEFSINPSKTSKEAELLELKVAIVKHILDLKIAEKNEKLARDSKEARRKDLRELIAIKKGEADQSKNLEELQKELDALDD